MRRVGRVFGNLVTQDEGVVEAFGSNLSNVEGHQLVDASRGGDYEEPEPDGVNTYELISSRDY